MPDLAIDHAALRSILLPYAAKLDIKRDDGVELYVDTRHVQKNRKPLFFGAVQTRKAWVSYHLMPVYTHPELLEPVSEALRTRMHGKSCFNFAAVEPALFTELAALTQAGFECYAAQGFVGHGTGDVTPPARRA